MQVHWRKLTSSFLSSNLFQRNLRLPTFTNYRFTGTGSIRKPSKLLNFLFLDRGERSKLIKQNVLKATKKGENNPFSLERYRNNFCIRIFILCHICCICLSLILRQNNFVLHTIVIITILIEKWIRKGKHLNKNGFLC